MSTNSSEATGSGLARQLAHTDKTVRERAMVAVGAWLRRTEDVSRDDLLKLWKALYYCMWMADKVPVQQELAHQMAALIGQLQPKRALLFMDVFMETMVREWPGTDRHRLDKFYSLIRFSVLEILQVFVRKSWTVEFATELSRVLFSCLASDAARGISLHIADLIVSELRKAFTEVSADDEIACEVLQVLLQPFVEALALPDTAVTHRVRHEVFAPLLKDAEAFGANEDEEEEGEKTCTLTTLVILNAGVLSDVFFELASNPDVLEEGRHELYELRKGFRKIHHLIEQGVAAEEEHPDDSAPDAAEQQATETTEPVEAVPEQQRKRQADEVVEAVTPKKRRRRRQSSSPVNGKPPAAAAAVPKDVFDVPSDLTSTGGPTLPAADDGLEAATKVQTPKKSVTFSKKKLVRKFNHRTPIKVVESTKQLIAKKSPGSVLRQTTRSARAR